jgi:AcrR family transcriptional regulator
MRQIAASAGISKALLYHYFPSKTALFKAAVAQYAIELQGLIAPDPTIPPAEQLSRTLDAYLRWIETHARTWIKLMQSAATLPEAERLLQDFRAQTLQQIMQRLTVKDGPPPILRTALNGWLGFVDAALLDWIERRDVTRQQVHQLILTAFGAAITAAQQAVPELQINLN